MASENNPRTVIDSARAQGVRYFASGSNSPGEILGLADCGIDVGVAIQSLHSEGPRAIAQAVAENPSTRVFVDSGAFSEVSFPGGVPTIVAPITDDEWARRLGAYLDLAQAIGSQLYAAAPDCVAHQAETLARMARYAAEVQAVAAAGAFILVPCQKGELDLATFWARAVEALGVSEAQLVAAIPMMKDETSTAEYRAFLTAARPGRVHLLGLGPKGARFAEVVEATPAGIELMCDSVLITSLVGWTNGLGGGPRALTASMDTCREDIEEGLFAHSYDLAGFDWTEAAACPSEWLTTAGLKRLAADLGLAAADARALVADVDGWLQDDERYLDPRVELALEALFAHWVRPERGNRSAGRGTTEWRKREGLVRLLGQPAPVALPPRSAQSFCLRLSSTCDSHKAMQTLLDFDAPLPDCCPCCGEDWLYSDLDAVYCLDIRQGALEAYAVFVPCCQDIADEVAAYGYEDAMGVSVERVLSLIGGYEVLECLPEGDGAIVARLTVHNPAEVVEGKVDRNGITKATGPKGWQAEVFADVAEHHSHHAKPNGWKFGVAVYNGAVKVGVMVVAPPVSRVLMQAQPRTAEVTRGTILPVRPELRKNAATKLYAAACKQARALGYDRVITYTMAHESGHSLVAAGWTPTVQSTGGSWDRPVRGRLAKSEKTDITGEKVRWEKGLTRQAKKEVSRLSGI